MLLKLELRFAHGSTFNWLNGLKADTLEPGGKPEAEQVDGCVRYQAVTERVEQQIYRRVGSDALELVVDRGIGEALDQLELVAPEIDAGNRCQRGTGLAFHQALHVTTDRRILDRLPHGLIAAQRAEACGREVTGIEKPQLHVLIR